MRNTMIVSKHIYGVLITKSFFALNVHYSMLVLYTMSWNGGHIELLSLFPYIN